MTFGQNEISINGECINIKNKIFLSVDKWPTIKMRTKMFLANKNIKIF